MDLIYKKADLSDIDMLTETRIEVLRAANRLSADVDMSEVRRELYAYYERALANNTHTAYLVSGNKAYIMNMYTHPDYRRKGIAFKVLGMLVKECYARNITAISLEATDMGRPLYEKYGFIKMEHEMELPKIQNGERK